MTDKQITITTCPYQGDCSISGCNKNDDDCFIKQLFEERYKADKQIVELNKTIKAKEQECKRLKWFLQEIRMQELSHLDIEWDESETSARQEDYSNIITLVERALGEIDD